MGAKSAPAVQRKKEATGENVPVLVLSLWQHGDVFRS
jgi:hypothetical protein